MGETLVTFEAVVGSLVVYAVYVDGERSYDVTVVDDTSQVFKAFEFATPGEARRSFDTLVACTQATDGWAVTVALSSQT